MRVFVFDPDMESILASEVLSTITSIFTVAPVPFLREVESVPVINGRVNSFNVTVPVPPDSDVELSVTASEKPALSLSKLIKESCRLAESSEPVKFQMGFVPNEMSQLKRYDLLSSSISSSTP